MKPRAYDKNFHLKQILDDSLKNAWNSFAFFFLFCRLNDESLLEFILISISSLYTFFSKLRIQNSINICFFCFILV